MGFVSAETILQLLKFCVVGGTGLVIQSTTLYVLTRRFGMKDFVPRRIPLIGKQVQLPYALSLAVVGAVAFNFTFDKLWAFS